MTEKKTEKTTKEDEFQQVAADPITGKDTPGVAGDENHRVKHNDAAPDPSAEG